MYAARPLSLVAAVIAAGLLSASIGSGQALDHRPEGTLRLSVESSTAPLHQGGVGLLVVKASTELASLEGQALGRPVHFWPDDSRTEWRGLVGIGPDTRTGSHIAVVEGTGASGETGTARVSLRIAPKQFETRRLKVAPAMVNPPQSEAARIARESKAMADALAVVGPERLWRGRFEAPIPGTATSSFGRLTVMNGERRGRHQGADFRAATGTPVRAPNAGRVVLAQDLYFAGNTVIVDHGLGVFSLVAHLSQISVSVGEMVARGGLLGESGATGRVTGPHLHWAVRIGSTSVDPASLMAASAALPDESAPEASN